MFYEFTLFKFTNLSRLIKIIKTRNGSYFQGFAHLNALPRCSRCYKLVLFFFLFDILKGTVNWKILCQSPDSIAVF